MWYRWSTQTCLSWLSSGWQEYDDVPQAREVCWFSSRVGGFAGQVDLGCNWLQGLVVTQNAPYTIEDDVEFASKKLRAKNIGQQNMRRSSEGRLALRTTSLEIASRTLRSRAFGRHELPVKHCAPCRSGDKSSAWPVQNITNWPFPHTNGPEETNQLSREIG